MTSHRFLLAVAAALVGVALPAATAGAQAIPAACRPLLDAQRKTIMTPHHLYAPEAPATPGAKARTNEMISVGGVSYLLYEGKWMRSPLTPKAQLDQLEENIANVKAFSCKRVGTESVGGAAADVYTSHDEHDGTVGESRIWVAKGRGVVLRIEEDLDTGAGGKHHVSIRYEYASVRAPAGVK